MVVGVVHYFNTSITLLGTIVLVFTNVEENLLQLISFVTTLFPKFMNFGWDMAASRGFLFTDPAQAGSYGILNRFLFGKNKGDLPYIYIIYIVLK